MSEPNVKGRWESFLPDEIIINILCRLQVKDVLRCRCVVKRWRDLTSTSHFVDLHKQHGVVQMVVVDLQKRKKRQWEKFFLGEWWLGAREKSAIHSYPEYYAEFSQDGLLVMSTRCTRNRDIVIVNPAFPEKVRIVISADDHSWIRKVYGIYFNPTLKEYCALLEAKLRSSPVNSPVAFKMLNLGPKPCLKDIKNPYKVSSGAMFLGFKRPVSVGEYLYWMAVPKKHDQDSGTGDIMEFDIRSEEFKLMRYPVQMITEYYAFGIDLLNIDGVLSVVQISRGRGIIDVHMWTLKDRASESWTSSHYGLRLRMYPTQSGWVHFETIAVKYRQLLIRYDQRLLVCNLEQGTSKILGKKMNNEYSSFFSHGMCLSSLKNCKPVIRIGNRQKCQCCDSLDKEDTSSSSSGVSKHSDFVEENVISALDEGAGSSTYLN